MQPSALPVASSTVPFWRTERHALDEHRSTAELPEECDVLIIGAGYAGITTAYNLVDEIEAPPSIVLLEARQACSGATGRNGGHLRPSPGAAVFDKYGVAAAVEVALFEIAHLQVIKDLVEMEKIDCELSFCRARHVITNPGILQGLKGMIEAMRESSQTIFENWHFVEGAAAEEISGVKGALAVFICDAGQLWPYKLLTHLLALAMANGVNLQTNTPVLSASKIIDEDGFWHFNTPRGTIKARKVVYTTNGFTSALLPEYAGVIFPVRAICSHIKIPKDEEAPKLLGSYCINYNQSWDYLIQREDQSIIAGGGGITFRDDYSQWRNNVNDNALIEPARHYFDNYMQRNFKDWEDSGAYVDKIWTGITGCTPDSLPHIGSLPNKSSQFVLAGFNGHGMPVIFLAAKGIAQMIKNGITFEETGMPHVFKTTQQRLDQKV
ncbi:Gamma-glutamylputrescine oxidoreductase [Hyphodiscus hymeniophilus]|uniref:Gamma-glutamylputrescine oxidoreductase n=1 Tax=Hyphodiscus hymeniophilus TaxID=353542 RepID=A0A9P6VRR6_9HELO|nr:Gamma-glutamylputrescine oxidoreductase [Hyphodiscus hymeniophilus]